MFRLILCLMLLTLFIICIVLRSVYRKEASGAGKVGTVNELNSLKRDLPWFFKNGTDKATYRSSRDISDNTDGDRIVNQLLYKPLVENVELKRIFLFGNFQKEIGYNYNFSCPVNKCKITYVKRTADAVVYKDFLRDRRDFNISPNQVWVLYRMVHPQAALGDYQVNWTATYRSNSDLVVPYGKWLYYGRDVKAVDQEKNYADKKTKKVAMITHCRPGRSAKEYVQKLKSYIRVDIYGECGDFFCPEFEDCLKMIGKRYKFYLAFEDVQCREYITGKFFDALQSNILPVVMGPPKDDYAKVAPFNSYIHVEDFQSPKQLADYLNLLHQNDILYNKYFQWKGTGEFIDTHFFCRLCAMLHSNPPPKFYKNVGQWWNDSANCTSDPWKSRSWFDYFSEPKLLFS